MLREELRQLHSILGAYRTSHNDALRQKQALDNEIQRLRGVLAQKRAVNGVLPPSQTKGIEVVRSSRGLPFQTGTDCRAHLADTSRDAMVGGLTSLAPAASDGPLKRCLAASHGEFMDEALVRPLSPPRLSPCAWQVPQQVQPPESLPANPKTPDIAIENTPERRQCQRLEAEVQRLRGEAERAVFDRARATFDKRGSVAMWRGAEATEYGYIASAVPRHPDVALAMDALGRTWLHLCPSVECADALLAAKADANACDGLGNSPLHLAAACGVVELLLARGADARATNSGGFTALHRARDAASAVALLGRNADVHAAAAAGQQPLHYARDAQVAEVLLRAGADVAAKDRSGATALDGPKARAVREALQRMPIPPLSGTSPRPNGRWA